ncbi:hypothetical protein GCM10009836_25040 [Pseudonocardia ailaonensis]|uniref:DUF112 domain-containing protein n=1 Tax=Pseudonocardia ailaonensis TaxID=367279 RepID=A0ABN2MYN4_9PSEU
MDPLTILVVLGFCVLGTLAFTLIGLVSGTDETATIAPLTLLVVLLGAPAPAVFGFFMSAMVAKHITHAIPTALLGIPGDTMAIPLMREANPMRGLGAPHVALCKMVSASVVAVFVSLPLSVLFAVILSPLGSVISAAAPWIFLSASVLIAYFSPGRWASVVAIVPFVFLVAALQAFSTAHGLKPSVSYSLGVTAGPLIIDLLRSLSPRERRSMSRTEHRRVSMAPDVKSWSGFMPNPFKVLDPGQTRTTVTAAAVTSATFVFSPVATTVAVGEYVGARTKHAYRRLTSVLAVRNGVTESTYIAEVLIPLIAFGLPLSPVAIGPAAPLFNAPPRFTVDPRTGEVNNLHTMLSVPEFLFFGLAAALIAVLIAPTPSP